MDAIQMPHVEFESNGLDLRYRFAPGGIPIQLETNSEDVVRSFSNRFPSSRKTPEFTFQIKVHNRPQDLDLPRPSFFGMDQFAGALFGEGDFLSFDLRSHIGIGFFSMVTASDASLWEHTILPTALGLAGPQLGLVPVHCAALVHRGRGALFAGLSGAGKSTLAAALAEAGMSLVSDDWAFASDRDTLHIFGMNAPLKLMPDAFRFFPALARFTARTSLNGELAYEVSAAELFGAPCVQKCSPGSLFLLERGTSGTRFSEVAPEEVLRCLYASLEPAPQALEVAEDNRRRILEKLAHLPCWRLSCGDDPQQSARAVIEFLERGAAR